MEEKIRISDLFKKSKDEDISLTQGVKFSKPDSEKIEESKETSSGQISFSSPTPPMVTQSEASADIITKALYSEAVSRARQIYKNPPEKSDVATWIYGLAPKIVDLPSPDIKQLLILALGDYPQPEDWLYYHVVNVSIFSLVIGQGMAYKRSHLIELVVAAFLHDIGMTAYLDIINQGRKLNLHEYREIVKHPMIGPEIIKQIDKNINSHVIDIICHEHERIDGSGYPEGSKNGEISDFAQIVGLTDVYEAMIHQRPYRQKHNPAETIKVILSNKHSFDHRLVKMLINKIGIFPIGTLVQLNNKEIGQVIKRNSGLPLRPVVDIIFDASGRKLKSARQIDLAGNPTIYILGVAHQPK